jgi:hypothetical protein
MAILTTFKVTGDPDELLAIAREKVAPAANDIGPANGRISATIVRTDTGLMLVNVWETEEGMQRTAEQVGPIARDSGMPQQEDWQMYEVLDRA